MKERVAIVGGGIGGLVSAYLLSRRYDVTLFEKDTRLGGNACTIDTREGHRVDIAVAAFGRAGYPHFYRLLEELGIRAEISLGASASSCNLETRDGRYMTFEPAGLRAQRFGVLRPTQIREAFRLKAGVERAVRMLDDGMLHGSLEDALKNIPELSSGAPRRNFLFSLCLLTSMNCDEVLSAPATFLIEKLKIHSDVISWKAFWSIRCIAGGTRRYVDALRGRFDERLGEPIRKVVREDRSVTVVNDRGSSEKFDHVVMATNADRSLAMLDAPTDRERDLLGAWRYKDGSVVVHRDLSAFPEIPLIQAYTFLYTERGNRLDTSVNGCLWREPGVSRECRLISSQHPNFPIRDDLVEYRTVFRTPIFDDRSCRTRSELPSLNGIRRTWYCGSHFGHGLHEDAVASAIQVAEGLGVAATF